MPAFAGMTIKKTRRPGFILDRHARGGAAEPGHPVFVQHWIPGARSDQVDGLISESCSD